MTEPTPTPSPTTPPTPTPPDAGFVVSIREHAPHPWLPGRPKPTREGPPPPSGHETVLAGVGVGEALVIRSRAVTLAISCAGRTGALVIDARWSRGRGSRLPTLGPEGGDDGGDGAVSEVVALGAAGCGCRVVVVGRGGPGALS
jgi:hypothetical protein